MGANREIKSDGNVIIKGITYPSSDGTDGQAIVTDGSGNLSFGDVSTEIESLFLGEDAATIISDLANDTIYFSSEIDIGSEYSASTETFTTNAAGYYEVNAILRYTHSGNAANIVFYIRKNQSTGGMPKFYAIETPTTNKMQVHMHYIVNLSAGDDLDIYVTNNTSDSLEFSDSYVSIKKL